MKADLVVLGASAGGVSAMRFILSRLGPDFQTPMALVLHREKHTNSALAEILGNDCPLPVIEVEDKQAIEPGHVYLGPSDYHLLVEPGQLCLSVDPPVMYARPSIDVLFDSAADAYRGKVAGILLTGASADGAQGLKQIADHGGLTIVQDPCEAQEPAMPRAALELFRPSKILKLSEIVSFLNPALRAQQGQERAVT